MLIRENRVTTFAADKLGLLLIIVLFDKNQIERFVFMLYLKSKNIYSIRKAPTIKSVSSSFLSSFSISSFVKSISKLKKNIKKSKPTKENVINFIKTFM